VFKKCREHPDDILFIDASAHFEKAKNQNFLRPEDIARIVETYRERSVTPKYSHRADITSEIAKENGYNLNIPRYVDTFEEDEPVDLEAVAKELADLEKTVMATDKTISDFCAELRIKAPV